METLKKWWPTILPVLIAMFTAAVPALQQLVSAHPVIYTALSGVGWVIAHLLKSPLTARR